jgi:UDP-glucuronate 4-epimerase
LESKRALLTGCAGFIGFHVTRRLLKEGYEVVGVDNLNSFYNEGLKDARLEMLRNQPGFQFIHGEIADNQAVQEIFRLHKFGPVVHLAAQAGVRHSLENPHLYVQSNVVGFVNMIEEARKHQIRHFVFASSSSVYGANTKIPFSEHDNVDYPVSLYAATKKSDELMAHVYAHLYALPTTGLRFFTVYGPWGRPDMAMFKFCKAIMEGTPIELYNFGKMHRDFTYIDDIVEGVVRVIECPPGTGASPQDGEDSSPPYRIFNIGNNSPIALNEMIHAMERKIGKKAIVKTLPMQPGDVPATHADIEALFNAVGYRPHTSIEDGISHFVDWYCEYYLR